MVGNWPPRRSRPPASSACSRCRAATSWPSTTAASTRASRWSTSATSRLRSHAADAWARLNPGKVGVAILTAGPGVTDGVTGVANAWRANSPILVFGGQAPFNNLRRGSSAGDGPRRADAADHQVRRRLLRDRPHSPNTSSSRCVTALSGVPGPAFLEIPMDVLSRPVIEVDSIVPPRSVTTASRPQPNKADRRRLRSSCSPRPQPVGHGRHVAEVVRGWRRAAPTSSRRRASPCYTNGMARGLLAMDHPQFFNRTRRTPWHGRRRDPRRYTISTSACSSASRFRPNAKIIQLDLDETLIGQNRASRRRPGRQPGRQPRPAARRAGDRARPSSSTFREHSQRAARRRRSAAEEKLATRADSRRGPHRPAAAVQGDRRLRRRHRRTT